MKNAENAAEKRCTWAAVCATARGAMPEFTVGGRIDNGTLH